MKELISTKTNRSYSELLKDPRWQKKRLKIMERDEFTCQSCFDSENTLNIHHKYYIHGKAPWEYPDELLITLCKECHEYWEENKYIINDFTKVLLAEGYTIHNLIELLGYLRELPSGDYGLSYILDSVKQRRKQIKNG